MSFYGVILGVVTLLTIGFLHPIVIKSEYYFGKRVWPAFFVAGLICLGGSLFTADFLVSAILGIAGFSLWWSIHELFRQEQRVEKGWFPANPNKQA